MTTLTYGTVASYSRYVVENAGAKMCVYECVCMSVCACLCEGMHARKVFHCVCLLFHACKGMCEFVCVCVCACVCVWSGA